MHKTKIIDINKIHDFEHWVPVPCYINKKRKIKFKRLYKKKGNCYFAVGIPFGIINFIYRSTLKLNLKENKLIFSKGAVKINNLSVNNAIQLNKLDWDVGISFIIPRKLNYKSFSEYTINNKKHKIRNMEVLVLSTLLKLAKPGKSNAWYTNCSQNIIINGWKSLVE